MAGGKSAKKYSDFAKFKLEQLHTLNVNITEHYHLRFCFFGSHIKGSRSLCRTGYPVKVPVHTSISLLTYKYTYECNAPKPIPVSKNIMTTKKKMYRRRILCTLYGAVDF